MDKPRILVPTDLSDEGNSAFVQARKVCSLFGGSITPIYVVEQTGSWESFISDRDDSFLNQEAEEKLRNCLTEVAVQAECSKDLNRPVIRYGDITDEILKCATNHDLVVMSTHGRNGFKRLMIGSVTRKIVSLSYRPVIITEHKTGFRFSEKLLVTTDFSGNSKEVFPHALRFAKKTGYQLDVVHMLQTGPFHIKPDHEILKSLQNKLEELVDEHFSELGDQVKAEILITKTSVSEALTNLINTRDYHMVFISTLGNTNLKNLMTGSVASSLIRLVDSAVFSVNPRGRIF